MTSFNGFLRHFVLAGAIFLVLFVGWMDVSDRNLLIYAMVIVAAAVVLAIRTIPITYEADGTPTPWWKRSFHDAPRV